MSPDWPAHPLPFPPLLVLMMCQVLSFSDLGVTVGLEGGFQGLIYAEELDFQREGEGLRVGDNVSLFVQKVRRRSID